VRTDLQGLQAVVSEVVVALVDAEASGPEADSLVVVAALAVVEATEEEVEAEATEVLLEVATMLAQLLELLRNLLTLSRILLHRAESEANSSTSEM